MQKLRTSKDDPATASTDEIIETLLVESGASKRLPTDADTLLEFLGLKQLSFDFMNEEAEFLEGGSNTATANVRAVLSVNERLVAVQPGLGQKRIKFSVLHEIGHFIMPEHRDRLFLDTDETLSWRTKIRLEREANQAAADLLFQGYRFTDESLDREVSIQTILELAPRFGASYEAALRRFAERHVLACAVIVYDKVARTNETDFEDDIYRVQYTVTSEPFRNKFFARVQTTQESLPGPELYKPKAWGGIVTQQLTVEGGQSDLVFDTEVFSNGYKIFQLITRPAD